MKNILYIILAIVVLGLLATWVISGMSGEDRSDILNLDELGITDDTGTTEDLESSNADEEDEAIEVQEIIMESKAFSFDSNEIHVAMGVPVRLTIDSDGGHTFTIDELGIDVETPKGETVYEFTPSVAGEYEFYCAIPGHRAQGQFGKLIVVDPNPETL